ncbi:hypothetical protein BaRGS_00002836 [Batillaria attramentaria]|uniref:Uncharacterized protein n=1 Tax=Batillaria attramentaria TaxID=370345 RepID=A0ABD0M2S4_9CAEN
MFDDTVTGVASGLASRQEGQDGGVKVTVGDDTVGKRGAGELRGRREGVCTEDLSRFNAKIKPRAVFTGE